MSSIRMDEIINRSRISAFSALMKIGYDPNEAIAKSGITDLEATVRQTGYHKDQGDQQSEKPEEIGEFIHQLISDDEGIRSPQMNEAAAAGGDFVVDSGGNDRFKADGESESSSGSGRCIGGGDGEKVVKKVMFKKEVSTETKKAIKSKPTDGKLKAIDDEETLAMIEKELETNSLEDSIEWLVTEAEHCAHTLMMANGNVLVGEDGKPENKFMWTDPDHDFLFNSSYPQRSATDRLITALKSLKSLIKSIQSSDSLKQRFVNMAAMINASGPYQSKIDLDLVAVTKTKEFPKPNIAIISFEGVLTDGSGAEDLYLFKNGLPGYVEATGRLVDKATTGYWNLSILTRLHESNNMICDFEQVRKMIGKIPDAKKITDIRIGNTYISLFRSAFMNLKFKDKKRIMACFYEQHGVPMWQMMDDNLPANLTVAVNKLCAQTRSKEYVQQMANQFAWFFMISLKYTWWHILENILRMPAIIPIIVEMLRQLEPVTGVRSEKAGTRLILIGVRRLVDAKKIENDEHEGNWIRLVCSLVWEKSWLMSKSQKAPLKVDPVVDITEGISTMILPLLESNPKLAFGALLAIVGEGIENRINWTHMENTKMGVNGINAAKLFTDIIEAHLKAKKEASVNVPVARMTLKILPLLVEIWVSDEFIFSPREVDQLGGCFEALPWTMRYLVFYYLRKVSKESVKLPMSKCLADIFRLSPATYRCVDCDDWSENHSKLVCSFTGLFQMAIVSFEMAENILARSNFEELISMIKADQLNEPIMISLVRVLSETESKTDWRNCSDLFTVIFDRLKVDMGVDIEETLGVKSYSEGLRMVLPALKLCEAVNRMIQLKPQSAADYVRKFSMVANEIVMERVQSMHDPLGKFVAWESLILNCCALSTSLGRKSLEMNTLLLGIFNSLKNERIVANLDLMKAASEFLEKDTKVLVLEGLEELMGERDS